MLFWQQSRPQAAQAEAVPAIAIPFEDRPRQGWLLCWAEPTHKHTKQRTTTTRRATRSRRHASSLVVECILGCLPGLLWPRLWLWPKLIIVAPTRSQCIVLTVSCCAPDMCCPVAIRAAWMQFCFAFVSAWNWKWNWDQLICLALRKVSWQPFFGPPSARQIKFSAVCDMRRLLRLTKCLARLRCSRVASRCGRNRSRRRESAAPLLTFRFGFGLAIRAF